MQLARLWGANQHEQSLVVGIDAGSVDVRVAVAALRDTDPSDGDPTMRLLGFGAATAQGIRRGVVTDVGTLAAAVRAAVARAEERSGHRLLRAYFSVPLTQFKRGDLPASNRAPHWLLTSPDEIRALTHGALDRHAAWSNVAEGSGLHAVGMIPSVVAASAAVVLPEERELGVIVVECGAEHTSLAVFSRGALSALGMVPVGGDHITRDLAALLSVEPVEAERLKIEVGSAHGRKDPAVIVRDVAGGATSVSVALVAAIVTARVDQILGYVAEMLRLLSDEDRSNSGPLSVGTGVGQVILCGGGATLCGFAPMARAAFGMPVRIAGAWGFRGHKYAQSPAYASVLGLLRWRAVVRRERAALRSSRIDAVNVAHAGALDANEISGVAMRNGQTRWQAWLREFLP